MKPTKPMTRREQYLSKIAGGDNYIPEPITREEQYLYDIAKNGGIPGENPDLDGDGEPDRMATNEEVAQMISELDDL